MKDILFICNGIALVDESKLGMSGGDARLFEIMRRTTGFRKSILVAFYGDKILEQSGMKYYKKYVINYRVDSEIKSNAIICFKSLFQFPKGLSSFSGIVYSSCEHLYDILPALRLKIFNKCEWHAVYHWVEEYPWKDKRGGTPFLNRYLYWLNRYFSGLLIKLFADKILAVSETTKEKLIAIKGISPNRIKPVYCGVDYKKIVKIAEKYKKEKGSAYDAVYMKRLSAGKGAFDLLKIWKSVCLTNKDAKLAVIGNGSESVVKELNSFIVKNNLENNIKLLGSIYNFEEKFRVLNSSKMFILPTYEENWAIVIGEAMAINLPVICYELKEITPIWKDNILWVKVGDTNNFAREIVNLLKNEHKRHGMALNASDFITQYDWDQIAKNEFSD